MRVRLPLWLLGSYSPSLEHYVGKALVDPAKREKGREKGWPQQKFGLMHSSLCNACPESVVCMHLHLVRTRPGDSILDTCGYCTPCVSALVCMSRTHVNMTHDDNTYTIANFPVLSPSAF